MVTSIARQSIIIKCNMQKGTVLGNYEFYYAAGVAAKLYGIEIPDEIQPQGLGELLAEKLDTAAAKDEKEQFLIRSLKEYVPREEYDEQMKELLLWGKGEEYLWQVVIPS